MEEQMQNIIFGSVFTLLTIYVVTGMLQRKVVIRWNEYQAGKQYLALARFVETKA
jgi:hypothetical protein